MQGVGKLPASTLSQRRALGRFCRPEGCQKWPLGFLGRMGIIGRISKTGVQKHQGLANQNVCIRESQVLAIATSVVALITRGRTIRPSFIPTTWQPEEAVALPTLHVTLLPTAVGDLGCNRATAPRFEALCPPSA